MTALARVERSWCRYLGLARKAIAPAVAPSSVATRSISTAPSPTSSARAGSASNLRAMPPASRLLLMRLGNLPGLLVSERLDHSFGDVDARAGVNDWILDDQIELLIG